MFDVVSFKESAPFFLDPSVCLWHLSSTDTVCCAKISPRISYRCRWHEKPPDGGKSSRPDNFPANRFRISSSRIPAPTDSSMWRECEVTSGRGESKETGIRINTHARLQEDWRFQREVLGGMWVWERKYANEKNWAREVNEQLPNKMYGCWNMVHGVEKMSTDRKTFTMATKQCMTHPFGW